jgi:hypothetical protein
MHPMQLDMAHHLVLSVRDEKVGDKHTSHFRVKRVISQIGGSKKRRPACIRKKKDEPPPLDGIFFFPPLAMLLEKKSNEA